MLFQTEILLYDIEIKKTKFVQCIDCGEWIEVDEMDYMTNRCNSCYDIYRRGYKAEKERIRMERLKRGQCLYKKIVQLLWAIKFTKITKSPFIVV